jgi:hypothetical protein
VTVGAVDGAVDGSVVAGAQAAASTAISKIKAIILFIVLLTILRLHRGSWDLPAVKALPQECHSFSNSSHYHKCNL